MQKKDSKEVLKKIGSVILLVIGGILADEGVRYLNVSFHFGDAIASSTLTSNSFGNVGDRAMVFANQGHVLNAGSVSGGGFVTQNQNGNNYVNTKAAYSPGNVSNMPLITTNDGIEAYANFVAAEGILPNRFCVRAAADVDISAVGPSDGGYVSEYEPIDYRNRRICISPTKATMGVMVRFDTKPTKTYLEVFDPDQR